MQDDTLPTPEVDQAPYKNEVTVLASTLSEGDTLPEIGDEVDLSVKGTVARISGDTICVTPTVVNDEPAPPVPPEKETPAEQGAPGEEADMGATRDKLLAGAMADDAAAPQRPY